MSDKEIVNLTLTEKEERYLSVLLFTKYTVVPLK